MSLVIKHSNNPSFIQKLIDAGYCAVECSIGGKSLTGPLSMDHHGENSHLEGVAVRAYRDHFGAGKDLKGYVVTGKGDADATFAIAGLEGLLPHPSNDITGKPWLTGFDQDVSELADLVNLMDTAPIGVRLEDEGKNGSLLLAFNMLSGGAEDACSFYAGVDRWRNLTMRPSKALLDAASESEKTRVEAAREVCILQRGSGIVALTSKVWGFDVWYADIAPCIIALTPDHNITIGCKDLETAETLFGPGGLKNVFAELQPEGWGGRETIGGSPRGKKMTTFDAVNAVYTLNDATLDVKRQDAQTAI